ncbi:MAG: sensor histidine kinase, partial [Desulfovibrio sp.]
RKQRNYIEKANRSAESLLGIINDILDFSKIEAGRLEIENVGFSLLEVMANVTEMFAYRAHDKDIELAVSVADNAPWALMGDPVRLGQILINLVNNAIKFTDQGEIVVSVAPAQDVSVDQEQVALRFRVKDTGIGIPQERLESIFSSFTQADGSTTRQYGGTGLGLTICRRLVGLMGGEIEARSEAGQGSEFVFTAVFGIQPHKEVRPQTPVDLRGLRVLVVDDNATSRDILAEIIASFQMEVDKARSGEQGVSKVQEAGVPYDLVLMDWKMPGMNGIEASRRIKQNKSLQQTPLICLVSAYGREDLIQQAEKAFIDAFLHKPVNQSLLFDTIMGLFGRESNLSGISSAGDEEIQATEYLRGAHFLLVEDNEINQEVAREWLESSGISVKVASNGKEALQALENETFDAVLMDVQMPEMDGYEATGHIRQQDKYKDLPIIAMTAHALKGDREKCLDAGMNDYVSKPIDPKLLFSVLSQWVKPSEQASPIQPPKAGKDADESMLLVKQLELPGIDVQEGLFRSNNNAGLYLKLLRSLHRDFSHAMEELDNALVSSDTNEAARIAHSLKGVAANVGATELSAKAAVVEVALSGQDLAREAEQIKDLGSEFQKVMLGLEQGIPEPQEQAEPGELLGRESTAEKILQIRDILDEDLETGRNMLQDILPSLRALVGGDRADAAQEYMDAFDIDGAVQALTEAYEVLGGKGGNDG